MLRLKELIKLNDLEVSAITHLFERHSKPSIERHIWITAQGIKIPVRKMTTTHIRNTIKCWNGQGKMSIPDDYLGGKNKWLNILNNELLMRQ